MPPLSVIRSSPQVRAFVARVQWRYYSAETRPCEMSNAVGGVPHANAVGTCRGPVRRQSSMGGGPVGTGATGMGFVFWKRAFSFFAARVIGDGCVFG